MASEQANNRTARLMRPHPITRETLLRLPLLVPRGIVREVTGLSDAEVTDEVRAGRIRTWRSPGSKQNRYYRDDLLRIALGEGAGTT